MGLPYVCTKFRMVEPFAVMNCGEKIHKVWKENTRFCGVKIHGYKPFRVEAVQT